MHFHLPFLSTFHNYYICQRLRVVLGGTMSKHELLKSLKTQGVPAKILDAVDKVPREEFVPGQFADTAYTDVALPLAKGATIAQPSTVAFMLEILNPHDKAHILEIGSGSGYVLALLSHLASEGSIHGLEINTDLVKSSKILLNDASHVDVHTVNGYSGFLRYAPYDRILVSAAYTQIPYRLIDQLRVGGILVVPVDGKIIKVTKRDDGIDMEEYEGFAFVDMQ